jgi:hypothetical protein
MKTEFDDALRGVYHEYDEVRPEQKEDYRSIGPLAITSFVLGVLSVLTFFWWPFGLIPIAAIILGVVATRKILRAPEAVSGFGLATAGIGIATLFLIGGYSWLGWKYYTQVPAGYEVVDFIDLAADKESGAVPPIAKKLADRKVFIRGYMYPTRKMVGIKDFTFVRTLAHCKFCQPTTNPTDMIPVSIVNGKRTRYKTEEIGVGGVLRVNEDYSYGQLPYALEVDVVR